MDIAPGKYQDIQGNPVKVLEIDSRWNLYKIQNHYGKPWVTEDWLRRRIKAS